PAPVIIAEPPPPVVIAEPPPPPVVIAEPPPPPEPVIVERILETIVERHYFIYPEILERLLALEAWQIAQGVRELATEPSPVPTFPIDPELLERILRLEIRQDLLEDQRFAPAPEPAPAPPQVVHVVPPPPQPAPTLPPIVFLQPPPVQPAPPPPTVFVPHTPPAPIQWPHVIPGLPNPHSGMVHRLQVGAFSSLESAVTLSNSMANAGFFVIHELHQGMFRVIALGVPASMVYPAIHRLASLGVTQVWIQ
ncbi:MAG: hypothetical protein FWB82_02455, partial [Treponema sp.]|nr:hypothetical protein [Treponema sp.]